MKQLGKTRRLLLKSLGLPALKEQKETVPEENAAKRTGGPLLERLPESAWQVVSSMPEVFRLEVLRPSLALMYRARKTVVRVSWKIGHQASRT